MNTLDLYLHTEFITSELDNVTYAEIKEFEMKNGIFSIILDKTFDNSEKQDLIDRLFKYDVEYFTNPSTMRTIINIRIKNDI